MIETLEVKVEVRVLTLSKARLRQLSVLHMVCSDDLERLKPVAWVQGAVVDLVRVDRVVVAMLDDDLVLVPTLGYTLSVFKNKDQRIVFLGKEEEIRFALV